MSTRGLLAAAAAGLAALTLHYLGPDASGGDASSPGSADSPSGSSSPTQGTYHPGAGELAELLAQVTVLADRPAVPGYDRECGTGHACSFGPAWTDNVDDHEFGHNGCDQRIICTV